MLHGILCYRNSRLTDAHIDSDTDNDDFAYYKMGCVCPLHN